MDERRAIERLKAGDVGGLEPLVRAYHDRARRAAYLVVRDRTLAEDVVQEAFVRAYEKIESFDSDRVFGPWFLKMVVNDALRSASRRERMVPLREGGEKWIARPADPGAGPEKATEEAETRRRVWAALGELPPVQRAAVVERYYLGLSEAEMAKRGSSPPGTIKSRLSAARTRLSKILRPQLRAQPRTQASVEHARAAIMVRPDGAEGKEDRG